MRGVYITPIVGLPQFTGWSQVVGNTDHSLICSLAIQGEHAGNVGRDLVSAIAQQRPRSSNELYQLISSWKDEVSQKDCSLHIAALVFTDSGAIFAALRGSIILKRNDLCGQILSAKGELKIVEGKNQPEDNLVLLTRQAEIFSQEVEQKLAQGFDPDTIITSVVPGLHAREDSSLSSLAFITRQATTVDTQTNNESESNAEEIQELDISRSDQPNNDLAISPSLTVTQPNPEQSEKSKTKSKIQVGKITNNFGKFTSRKIKSFASILKKSFQKTGQAFRLMRPSKDVYVRSYNPKRIVRRALPILGVIGLIMLTVGAYALERKESRQTALDAVAPIKEQIRATKEKKETELIQARDELEEIIAKLEELERSFSNKKVSRQVVEGVLAEARSLASEISGQEELGELSVFYDFSQVIETGFVALEVDSDEEFGFFLDTEKKQLVKLNLESKAQETYTVENANDIKDISVLDAETLVVLSKGIQSLKLESDEGKVSSQEIRTEGESNREALLVGTYTQYVYVLNPQKRRLYRYSKGEDGYSDPISWLTSTQGVEFDKIYSWSIDGDIWLATKEGKIFKFSKGESSYFNIQGLKEPFTSPLSIFTTGDQDNLYVLEPEQNRVVILTKEGEFVKEVKSVSLAAATALVASEELGKVLVVSGSVMFEIQL